MAIGTADITRPVGEAAETRPIETPTPSDTGDLTPKSIVELYNQRTQAYESAFGTPEQQRADLDTAKQRQAQAEGTAEAVYQGVAVPALVRQVQAARQPLPAVPQAVPEPPVPSQQIRPFMDVQEKHALGGLVSTLGMMAQMAMAGKAPVQALGALTGAMEGWRAGDQDRANREWREYLAQVDKVRQENFQNVRTFEMAMQTHGANIRAAEAEVIASLYGAGHYQAAAQTARDGVFQAYDAMQKTQQHADKLFTDSVKLIEMQENRKMRLEMERTRLQAQEQWHQQLLEQRRSEEQSRRETAFQAHLDRMASLAERRATSGEGGAGFTPEALELASQQYYTTGNLPPLGMGKASTEARVKIMNRAGELAAQAGTTGADFVARTQFAKGTQTELSALMRQRGQLMSFAQTADQNLDAALELSTKVDAKGVPVINRWALAGRKAIAGDPDVTQFDVYTNRAVAEVARLTSSATGGGVSTDSARREATELLKTSFTPEQFDAAVTALKNEVTFRREGFEKQIQAAQNNVRRLTPGGGGAVPPAPKPGMIRVRRKSDGQTGWLERKDLGDLYEEIEGGR